MLFKKRQFPLGLEGKTRNNDLISLDGEPMNFQSSCHEHHEQRLRMIKIFAKDDLLLRMHIFFSLQRSLLTCPLKGPRWALVAPGRSVAAARGKMCGWLEKMGIQIYRTFIEM